MDTPLARETELDHLDFVRNFGRTWISQAGEFLAIFEAGYTTGLDVVESRDPFLTCITADISKIGLVRDDTIRSGSDEYRVKRHEPDGTGISRLILKR